MEGFVALEDRVQRERRDSASAACAAGGACSKVEGLRICASLVEGAPKYKRSLPTMPNSDVRKSTLPM